MNLKPTKSLVDTWTKHIAKKTSTLKRSQFPKSHAKNPIEFVQNW